MIADGLRLQVAHPAALGLDYRRPLMRSNAKTSLRTTSNFLASEPPSLATKRPSATRAERPPCASHQGRVNLGRRPRFRPAGPSACAHDVCGRRPHARGDLPRHQSRRLVPARRRYRHCQRPRLLREASLLEPGCDRDGVASYFSIRSNRTQPHRAAYGLAERGDRAQIRAVY